MSETELLNFWFSRSQLDIGQKRIPTEPLRTVTIDGVDLEYTECSAQDRPFGAWKDYKFVGRAPESAIRINNWPRGITR